MQRKIYTENMVRFSTFLGGPLVGAYLMAENYKAFGKEKRAKKALQIGIISSVFIFAFLFLLPDPVLDKFPRFLIPLLSAFAASYMVRKYQAPEIENYLSAGGGKHSGLKVAGVSILVLALEILIAAVLFWLVITLFE